MKQSSGKLILLAFFIQVSNHAFSIELKSPDGRIRCDLTMKSNMVLSVTLDGKKVIEPSTLEMSVDGILITNKIKAGKAARSRMDETYPMKGLHSEARNLCNTWSIPVENAGSGLKYNLEFRVFNDAVAFRFIIPGDESVSRKPDESTTIKLPSKSLVWYHDLYMHYEGVHQKKEIDTIPSGQWAAPPLMARLPDGAGYVAITEANLVNYAGMALQSDGRNGFTIRLGHSHPASYPYILRYKEENAKRLSGLSPVTGIIKTPWRLLIIGEDLNRMVNSDAVYSLCPPPDKTLFPQGPETEWAKPGRAVWKYLDGGGDGTLSVMKKFSKEAADLGFEYNILEGFWSRWPDDSVKELVDYSKNLGVGIIVWKHSNTLHDPAVRRDLFKKCHELGIAGLKIDFFDHEAKEVCDLYETILRETAEQELVCIFHGANKPTGLWRTWPNAVIYESVKGMEASKLTDRASHETTIPFTRMLAGPADYSVCHFGTRRQNTTWAHQVATAAIYAAPVITYAATPEHILQNPCVGMVKSIPAVWDETIVLPPSEIGEVAVFAQRNGQTWFLSAINGLQPKSLKIPLSFLKDGVYKTLIIKDKPGDPANAEITVSDQDKNGFFDIPLGTGGGFIAKFEKSGK